MNKVIAKKIEELLPKSTLLIAVMALVISIFTYLYFLNSAILNVAERKNLEEEIVTLREGVLDLETEYIALEGSIGVETAERMGFVETPVSKYVSRKPTTYSLSLNNEI